MKKLVTKNRDQASELGAHHLYGTIPVLERDFLLDRLSRHLQDHEIVARRDKTGLNVDLPDLSARLITAHDGIRIDLASADLERLYFTKVWLDEAIQEAGGADVAEILWDDHTLTGMPPSFCILTVASTEDISPRLRRISFLTRHVHRFNTMEQMHLRLLMNFNEVSQASQSGCPIKPIWRVYTVRQFDEQTSTLVVDFVLHDEDGAGTEWAKRAVIGECLGAAGPCGGGYSHSDTALIAGDETALPAIARILASLDPEASVKVICEAETEADILAMPSRAEVEVNWLLRNGRQSRLADHVFSEAEKNRNFTGLWVACEAGEAKALRRQLQGIDHSFRNLRIFSYWHKEPA